MTRAVETADVVAQYLPNVPRSSDDLLREGAPYPPEPAVGHWKPEAHVSVSHSQGLNFQRVKEEQKKRKFWIP